MGSQQLYQLILDILVKKEEQLFLSKISFFSARTFLMFLGALERGDQGLSVASNFFEISSLSSENDAFKVGSVRTARAILDVY